MDQEDSEELGKCDICCGDFMIHGTFQEECLQKLVCRAITREFFLFMFCPTVVLLTDHVGVEGRRTAKDSKRHSAMLLQRQVAPYRMIFASSTTACIICI